MKSNPNIPHGLPVSVEAPVVIDAQTHEGIQPLFEYIGAMESNTSEAVAAAEGQRLGPYFDALSAYFRRALDNVAQGPDDVPHRDNLEKLSTPESLKGLFNAAAKRTHNVVTSSVAVLPTDIQVSGPASYLFSSAPQFSVPYRYNNHTFNFGFIQVYEGGDKKTAKSSMSIPTFLLDADMLRAVAPYQPADMLKEFQSVISWVNHDMLHHYTSPIINPIVTKKFSFDDVVKPEGKDGPVHTWVKMLHDKNWGSLYEQWALMSHEKVMLTSGNERQIDDVKKNVTAFFDGLARIGADIARDQGPEKAHDAVDYFGTVMIHALTRVFPLNHPMIAHGLDGLEKADPMPEKSVADAQKMVPAHKQRELSGLRKYFAAFIGRKPVAPPPQQDPVDALRGYAVRTPYIAVISSAYKKSGLDILPADNAQVSYRNIKMLQLLGFTAQDIVPHVPVPAYGPMADLQEKTDRSMLGMITAASQSFDYKPK